MALLKRSSEPDPIVTVLPISADPKYQELAARLDLLGRGLQERQDRLELYAIEASLRSEASTPAPLIGGRKWRLHQRQALLQERAPRPKAAVSGAPRDDLDPVIAVGLKLAAGETLPAPRDRSAHIAQLHSESEQIEAALRLVHVAFDEMREQLSFAVATTLLRQHRAILRSKLDGALALAAAVTAERELIATMVTAGYNMQPGVLMSPPLDPANRLGAPSQHDSAISTYRRALESLGII